MDRLVVGTILRPHGIRGEVVVDVVSDAPGRFVAGATLAAGDRVLRVASSRPHQGRMLVKFDEIPDRTAAESMRGVVLAIDAADAAPLPSGSYYPHDLEGCEVRDGSGALLGRLVRVQDGPAHDHWIVRAGTREVMVPAVSDIVREVDLAQRAIVLDPPEGLF